MSDSKKRVSTRTRPRRKRRCESGPLPAVVSLRISRQEKRMLEELARASARSVSELMREAILHWQANRTESVRSADPASRDTFRPQEG